MKLRAKIFSGFFILASMLFLAGVWSIDELTSVGTSVQKLIKDNYESINAARVMTEALEREDSAVLLLLSGNWDEGRAIVQSADLAFLEALQVARDNLTEPGEKEYVENIEETYGVYKQLWIRPIVGTKRERSLDWYFNEVHESFLAAKLSVQKLMSLNENAMYQTAIGLKQRAHRAVMPGIVAIIASLVFTLLFIYFVNRYLVSPIIAITKAIQHFLQTGEVFQVDIETDDELQDLASAIRNVLARSTDLAAGGEK